jgi:IS30 family transposase
MSKEETIDNKLTDDARPLKRLANLTAKPQRAITNALRDEVAMLAEAGTPIPAIAMTLQLSESQVERALQRYRQMSNRQKIAESVQVRRTSSNLGTQTAVSAERVEMRIIKKIDELVDTEKDISRLSTALKALHSIVQSAEVRTEVTSVLSRLRGE